MKASTIKIISGSTIIIFAFLAVLCPLDLAARVKKNDARARQAARQEAKQAKEAAEEEDKKASEKEAPAAEKKAAVKEQEKGATEGVPTKDYKEEDFKPAVEEESLVWMFIKMILILGIFGGGFYYFYRFVTKKTGMGVFGGEAIKVLSVVPLGQNKFLDVVDLAGKVLVVGVTDSNVNLITEITEKDQIDRIRILSSRTPPPGRGGGSFQDGILRQIGKIVGRMQEYKKRDRQFKSTPVDHPSDVEYLRKQRERLRGLKGEDDE